MNNRNDELWLDKIVDNYSIHQPKGWPKGIVARRAMKKRLHKGLDAKIRTESTKAVIAELRELRAKAKAKFINDSQAVS